MTSDDNSPAEKANGRKQIAALKIKGGRKGSEEGKKKKEERIRKSYAKMQTAVKPE